MLFIPITYVWICIYYGIIEKNKYRMLKHIYGI